MSLVGRKSLPNAWGHDFKKTPWLESASDSFKMFLWGKKNELTVAKEMV
jgi:hypothetical protein